MISIFCITDIKIDFLGSYTIHFDSLFMPKIKYKKFNFMEIQYFIIFTLTLYLIKINKLNYLFFYYF